MFSKHFWFSLLFCVFGKPSENKKKQKKTKKLKKAEKT
jgi:hypothetical protein